VKNPLDRGGIRFYLVLLALLAGRTTALSAFVGGPLVLLGVALHVWAKGCLEQNRTVTQSGPYRYVRHPFYLGNGLIDAGILVMSNWWVLQILAPIWWIGTYLPVMAREDGHLKALFGDAWRSYAARVPMLLPYRRPIAGRGEGFSWGNRNIAHGREIPRALRLLAYPFLLYAVSEMRRDGLSYFTDNWSLEFLMLVVAGMLHALAWEFGRQIKLRERILPEPLSGDWARAVFAGLMIVACSTLTYLEMELDHIALPIGGMIVVMAVLSARRLAQPVLECMSLVGMAVMCELVWLAALPILYYTALLLDSRLCGRSATFRPARQCAAALGPAVALGWLPAVCIVLSIAKEVAVG